MKASEAVYRMMKENNGKATVVTLQGKEHDFYLSQNEEYIMSATALPNQKIDFEMFDQIVAFIKQSGGCVRKGNGRNSKVGAKGCEKDTLMWFIATEIYGHKTGESTYDPISALAAVLDYAGIATNERGKIRLRAEYMKG